MSFIPRAAAIAFLGATAVPVAPALASEVIISPLLLPSSVPILVPEAAPMPVPEPVRAMIDAVLAGGLKRDIETVVSLARATNPRSVTDIDAIVAAWQAKNEGREEPNPVRQMLAAAIESKRDGDVEAVGKLAKATLPDQAAEIDTLLVDYRAERAEEKRLAAEAERARLAAAKFWENWKGEGQIGASHATGNSKSAGLSLGLALNRKGIDWNQRFAARADYQRTNGRTSIERYLAEYEPQIRVSDRAFAYGLGRWERDRIAGFDARWNLSAGMGYKVIAEEKMTLSLKAGPAWRQTEYVPGRGLSDGELTGLAGLDFGWQVTPVLRLTQVASTIVGERTTQASSLTALNAKLTGALSARVSYSAEIDTNPLPGIEKIDTLTRFTLVYGF